MTESLTNLNVNQTGSLAFLDQEHLDSSYIFELIDLGFLPGTEVLMVQKYSSQNKIIVQIGNSHLSLRMNDAKFIQVKVNES